MYFEQNRRGRTIPPRCGGNVCIADKGGRLRQSLDVPKTVLTEYGKIADNQLKTMSSFYEDIAIDKYVIMPNHIHLLISINDSGTGSSGTPTPTNEKIAMFVSTFKRFCNKQIGGNIWQRSYYDHIIRDDRDYRTRWKYIDENPIRWINDKYYSTM